MNYGKHLISLLLCGGIAMVSVGWFSLKVEAEPDTALEVTKTIGFEYVRKKIMLTVSIRSKALNFVIDTGVHPSVIDKAIAQSLGLPLQGFSGQVGGFGSENRMYVPTRIDTLEIDDLQVTNLKAVAVDMSTYIVDEIPIHGILGHDFLKRFATRIDYQNSTVTFFTKLPADYLEGRNITTCTFQLDGGLIPRTSDLVVEGEKISAWLDTGSGSMVSLTRRAAAQIGLASRISAGEEINARGSRGPFKLIKVDMRSASLCGAAGACPLEAYVFESGGRNLVGNDFFDDFTVTFDYPNTTLYLETL